MSVSRIAVALMSVAVLAGCNGSNSHDKNMSAKEPTASAERGKEQVMDAAKMKTAVAKIGPSRAATTMPSNSKVSGTVTFTEVDGKVMIVADLTGLAPGKHGFHIHDKGDLSAADLSSAGGHFNPGGHKHGAPEGATTQPSHAGDLGNITANEKGDAHLEITVDDISLGGGKNDVLGRSVIVHAKVDDLMTDPSGNSGGRIAGGVIEQTMKK